MGDIGGGGGVNLLPCAWILTHFNVVLSAVEQSPGHLATYVKMGPH